MNASRPAAHGQPPATALRATAVIVTLTVGAFAVVGVGAHAMISPGFEATAVVAVTASRPSHVDMAAEQALAGSQEVAVEAAAALDRPTMGERQITTATRLRVPPGSRTLHVGFRHGDPAMAAHAASALAYAYVAVRSLRPDLDPSRASTATVVTEAPTPHTTIGPGRATSGVAAGVLGLLIAAPLAAARAGVLTRTAATAAS